MPLTEQVVVGPAWISHIPPGADYSEIDFPAPGPLRQQTYLAGGTSAAAFDSRARTDLPGIEEGGVIAPSFFDWWYNRIHVEPSVLNLGNITADSSADVILWNAFLVSKPVQDDSLANSDGVTVSGTAAPYTLTPLQLKTYTVTVLEDGPASINLSLGWTIDGDFSGFRVVALRIVPFFYAPNWRDGVTESLEWRTSISQSRSGQEQRQRIRSKPRRSWSYSLMLQGDRARSAFFDITGYQNRVFGVPIWTDRSELTAQATSGASVLQVATANKGFAVGGALFVRSGDTIETHEVDAITGTTLSLKKPTTSTFPAGSEVYPGAVAKLPQSVSGRRVTDNLMQASIEFQALPQDTDPWLPSSSPTTLDGFEVIDRRPNWSQPVGITFEYEADEIDYLSGVILRAPSRGYPSSMFRLRYMINGRADMSAFRAMLGRLAGRHTPAWVNIHASDFVVVGTVVSGGAGATFTDNHSDLINPARHPVAVAFRTRSNGTIVNRLSSLTVDGDEIDAQFAASFAVQIEPSDLIMASFCPLCRLATDRVSIRWLTNELAECDLTFQMVSR